MGRNHRRIVFYIILFLFLELKVSSAQQILFSPRENAIFTTLNVLQEKQEAIGDSMKDAQIKLLENMYKAKEVKEKKVKPRARRWGFDFRALALKAHPYLTSIVKFDDNVKSAQKYEKSGFEYDITPGIKMNFFGRGKSLTWDTYIDNIYYQHYSQDNTQDITSRIATSYSLGRSILSISDSVNSNRITAKDFDMEIDEIEYYWKNSFSSKLGRYFNRIGFDVGYDNTCYDYEDDLNSLNHYEETYHFNQYLRIATKTRLLFDYAYGRTKYTHNLMPSIDSRFHSYNLGITGVLSPKLTGSMEIDCKLVDNKTASDYSDTAFMWNIGYRISDRMDLALALEHSIHEEKIKEKYMLGYSFMLTGNHRFAFNPRLNLSLLCSADLFDYPKRMGFNEETNQYSYGFGLSYAFSDWVDFSLNYKYNQTFSNVSADYNNNIVIFTTQARF